MLTTPLALSRRRFLAAAAASSAAYAAPRYAPKIGIAVYVYTQHFSRQKKTLAEGLEEMFAGCRKSGFRRIELMSTFVGPELFDKTAAMLKKYRMQCPVVYVGGVMYDAAQVDSTLQAGLEAARNAKKAGAAMISCNPSSKPRGERKTDSELDVQARCVNRYGEELRKMGLGLGLHQHAPEMAENAREYRHLLKNTDPKLAGIYADIDWFARGGQNPMELLREARDRIRGLHLRNSRGGVWTETVAEGEYDYPAIAAFLKEIGFDGYLMVELAWETKTSITRPLEENHRTSREYVEKVFGVKA